MKTHPCLYSDQGRTAWLAAGALLILLILSHTPAVAERASSPGYRLVKGGVLGGHTPTGTPVGSLTFRMTAGALGGISGPAQTANGYILSPGYLHPVVVLGELRLLGLTLDDAGVIRLYFRPMPGGRNYRVYQASGMRAPFNERTSGVFVGDAWQAQSFGARSGFFYMTYEP